MAFQFTADVGGVTYFHWASGLLLVLVLLVLPLIGAAYERLTDWISGKNESFDIQQAMNSGPGLRTQSFLSDAHGTAPGVSGMYNPTESFLGGPEGPSWHGPYPQVRAREVSQVDRQAALLARQEDLAARQKAAEAAFAGGDDDARRRVEGMVSGKNVMDAMRGL